MPRVPEVFKVRVEYADDAHEPQTLAVQKNVTIRTIADAVAHIMAVTGNDGTKDVTRIHHKDSATGEFFSVVKATPVSNDPFPINEAPRLRSLESAPQPGAEAAP